MSGYYAKEIRIKSDVTPIDNVTKFAWADDDYEEVEVWHEYTEEELKQQEDAKAQAEHQELIDSLPDAVADLSEVVSSNSEDTSGLSDALAELSEIVSTLVEGAKNNG